MPEAELPDQESLEQMIDELGKELIATSFHFIDMRRRKQKIDVVEREAHEDNMKEFKNIERQYNMMRKMGRIKETKPSADFDRTVLERIKQKDTTLGKIVRNSDGQ